MDDNNRKCYELSSQIAADLLNSELEGGDVVKVLTATLASYLATTVRDGKMEEAKALAIEMFTGMLDQAAKNKVILEMRGSETQH